LKKIFQSPFKVYLVLCFLALVGGVCGLQLPISLYPNSSKPTINANISYGSLRSEEFQQKYGNRIESALNAIDSKDFSLEKVETSYYRSNVQFYLKFNWGVEPLKARREVEQTLNSLSAGWPKEIRDSLSVNYWSKGNGFIAVSFFSEKRDLTDLYELVEPLLMPRVEKVKDADNPGFFNPNNREIQIELKPYEMASLNLTPRDIDNAVSGLLNGYYGGSFNVGQQKLSVQMPRQIDSIEKLRNVLVPAPNGKDIPLSQLARVYFAPNNSGSADIYKTNGAKSLILFASPKMGGNVKEMAESIKEIVADIHKGLPKDIEYRVLIDPSKFIRSSVNNVVYEVFLSAFLAVLVLFLFVGNLQNTITAALEIPLSMVLAFILMKLTGMNLNLISLGGLALSAGMNVDASVVVMENIFRYLEKAPKNISSSEKLRIITEAVKEVMGPILAATISSLVVFLPLAFTSDLTNAILGDLAKAVVFSHGFSALVAIVLVPTIRFHIMKNQENESLKPSPIEPWRNKLENFYVRTLNIFIDSKKIRTIVFSSVCVMFLVSVLAILPSLKKEIIGMPDTDVVMLGIDTSGQTKMGQQEALTARIEAKLRKKFGKDILYTFTKIRNPNGSWIMSILKDKSEMQNFWKSLEAEFTNTPDVWHWVAPWNPSELPIPDPPHMRLVITGGEKTERALVARDVLQQLSSKKAFPRNWGEPNVNRRENIILEPNYNIWTELAKSNANVRVSDLTDFIRVATEGRVLDYLHDSTESYPLKLTYPQDFIKTREDIESFPIGIKEKLIPLKALAEVRQGVEEPGVYNINSRPLFAIEAKQKKGDYHLIDESLAKAKVIVEDYWKNDLPKLKISKSLSYFFEDAQKELTQALTQLGIAISLSIALIFLTLLFQFGHVTHTLIILSAIPLGIIGVLCSLFVFQSTLSLNSALGIILLNGIAVANSIILVDFIKKNVENGMAAKEAALYSGQKRLRPILITSLTTILGMLPIAFGSGEGGKILQPLGIAVAGGLWVSTLFTLYIVPALEVSYFSQISNALPKDCPPKVKRKMPSEANPTL
jgi:multidrug efflux pump subunit AcrB